ncbi:bumetanide-sensitive Na-K-Cl cotransporter [Reticulomyxa filosa]|uniref:Bumetanide-sensitive Na-K-Cl cotransporter n=1 Tax=Reticulomyxa filosa TaxID=46433 RepID=X6LFC0_RETFI|nr:bumetanide-sensitive Na-K-Cl cotransporter [Reticulomyxa filosa]|eukprot:ETN99821.1 bumetanide-sensitive Na-K-Cl cotransporter [Reticulomyxa filosa]
MSYKAHVKNFQPSFLVMCGDPETRIPLAKFVYTLQRGHGTVIYANIIVGELTDHINQVKQTSGYLPEEMKMQAFFESVIASNVRQGGQSLFQLAGLGKLRANILVLGFKTQWYKHVPATLLSQKKTFDGKQAVPNRELEQCESNDEKSIDVDLQNTDTSTQQTNKGAKQATPGTFSNEDYVALLMDALICKNKKNKQKCKMGFMICRGLETLPFGDAKARSVNIETSELSENSLFHNAAVIDVWWLLDDGGLSLLVPHLMSIDRFWQQLSSMNTFSKDKKTLPKKFSNSSDDVGTRDANYMIRLFLVADDDIGTDTCNEQDNNTKEMQNPMSSPSQKQFSSLPPKSPEIARITKQGLVSGELLTKIQDTTDLWKAELTSLLQKFRLNINGPYTVKSGRREPTIETYEKFSELTGYKLTAEHHGHVWSNSKLKRWLRVTELVHAYSRNQRCVFVTAPFPTCFDEPTMYLGVLDMLSRTSEKRATVLIRGTGDNVLTFYSE